MTISAIIPTCGRPAWLEETIRSVWSQTRLPEEILVGDDSGGNETRDLVLGRLAGESPVPLHYFHHPTPLKEAANVDFLYSRAKGGALLQLHDDDPVYPRCIEVLLPPLEQDGRVAASFGNQHHIGPDGRLLPDAGAVNAAFYRTPEREGMVDGLWAGATQMFPNNGYVCRTDFARQVGYLGDGRGGYAPDFYFGVRLGKLGHPFFYVNEFTAQCRLTPVSTSRGNPEADTFYRILRVLLEDLTDEQRAVPEIRKQIENVIPGAITMAIRKGERRLAWQWLFSPYYRPQRFSPRWMKRLLQFGWPGL